MTVSAFLLLSVVLPMDKFVKILKSLTDNELLSGIVHF